MEYVREVVQRLLTQCVSRNRTGIALRAYLRIRWRSSAAITQVMEYLLEVVRISDS